MNDAFDLNGLRLAPEIAACIGKKPSGEQGPRQPRRAEPFLQISHKAIVAGSDVLRGTKQFLVWLYLFHRVWADKSRTVVLANQTLSTWGVGRREKYKALRQLEEAGLISVEWRQRSSPLLRTDIQLLLLVRIGGNI
jgi:hypothetical protein